MKIIGIFILTVVFLYTPAAFTSEKYQEVDDETRLIFDIKNGSTLTERYPSISGHVAPALPGFKVRINQKTKKTAIINTDGSFTLPKYLLREGKNKLQIELLTPDGNPITDDDDENEEDDNERSDNEENDDRIIKTLVISYLPPAEARGKCSPNDSKAIEIEVVDTNSPAFGAAVIIPKGACTSSTNISITTDAGHQPNLPFGIQATGTPITYKPLGQAFNKEVSVYIPFNKANIPAGKTLNDLKVYIAGEKAEWTEQTIESFTSNSVKVNVMAFNFSHIIVAHEAPIPDNTLLLQTQPSGATVYIDGFNIKKLSPAKIENLSSAEHTIKLYANGYNEHHYSINYDGRGLLQNIPLTKMDASLAPIVSIENPAQSEIIVTDNIFHFDGRITAQAGAIENAMVIVSVNGNDSYVSASPDGSFRHTLSLLSGESKFHVRATDSSGFTGVSREITVINAEPLGRLVIPGSHEKNKIAEISSLAQQTAANNQEIIAIVTWNKNDTDVDLHFYDPDGNHAWYGNLGGIPGAQLDHDDTNGFGPETFSMSIPRKGKYKVQLHYYSDHGNGPTTAVLNIYVGGTLITSMPQTLSHRQWGTPFEFEISDFSISGVTPNDGIFTTMDGEKNIALTLDIPDYIDPASISFSVLETAENHSVTVADGVTGNSKEFDITHEGLQSLTTPASHALTYEISASSGNLTTDAMTIEQDTRAQIRQEYVDKRDFNLLFVRDTPARTGLITAGQFPPSLYFTFAEIAAWSDYPAYAAVNQSVNIANTLRTAWGFPLRVTSGWRNPRRNDGLGASSINSYHQTGNAIDLNPSFNSANWPAGTTSYDDAQVLLTELAEETFAVGYDILFHNNHLHIEYKN